MKSISIFTAFVAAIPLAHCAPRIPYSNTCGQQGNRINVAAYSKADLPSLQDCMAACANSASQCQSLAYGNGRCRLFDVAVVGNMKENASSPFVFYDASCPDVLAAAAAPVDPVVGSSDDSTTDDGPILPGIPTRRLTPPSASKIVSSISSLTTATTTSTTVTSTQPQATSTDSFSAVNPVTPVVRVSTLGPAQPVIRLPTSSPVQPVILGTSTSTTTDDPPIMTRIPTRRLIPPFASKVSSITSSATSTMVTSTTSTSTRPQATSTGLSTNSTSRSSRDTIVGSLAAIAGLKIAVRPS